MLTNKRIFRYAQSILDLKEIEIKSPNEAFLLVVRMKNLTDYYESIDPDSFIKICISVWGFSQGFSTSEIENMFDKVFFAVVFYTEGELNSEQCDSCSGDGRIQCDMCDGTGNQECSECDGDGEVTCSECDGLGQIENEEGENEKCSECDGVGELTCSECNGSKEETCSYCGGEGDSTCGDCDGDGEVETDETIFSLDFIVSWSPYLYEIFETGEGRNESVMSISQFDKNDKIMSLASYSLNDTLNDDIESDEIYVLNVFSQRPSINFRPNRGTETFGLPDYNINHLLS